MKQLSRRDVLSMLGAASLSTQSLIAHPSTEKAKTPIKIGQIGMSHAHATKIAVYRESKDFEVVGIVEPEESVRKRMINHKAYKNLPVMTRDQLLNVPGLQAVLVETQVCDLLENAEICVQAGKHIQIDKPAGESLPKLKKIFDIAMRKKVLIQMGYMYRYNPAVLLLRDFLKKGWLGEIFEIHTVMSKVVDDQSRRELAKYPGGIMFELGCHVMDLVISILGKPDSVQQQSRQLNDKKDSLKDNMLAVLNYPKAIATVKSSALEVEGFERRHLVVCGTEGTFHIQPLDDPAAKVALSRDRDGFKKGYQNVTFPKYIRYVDDAIDFARIIRKEKATDYSPSHDLSVQESLLQACNLSIN